MQPATLNLAKLNAFVADSVAIARRKPEEAPELLARAQSRIEQQVTLFTLPGKLPAHLVGLELCNFDAARKLLAAEVAAVAQRLAA